MKTSVLMLMIGVLMSAGSHPVQASSPEESLNLQRLVRLQLYSSSFVPYEKEGIKLEDPPTYLLPRQDLMDFYSDLLSDRRRAVDHFYWKYEPWSKERVTFGWFVQSVYPTRIGPGKDFMATGIQWRFAVGR